MVPQRSVLLCRITSAFINEEQYKELFIEVGKQMEQHNLKYLVFDKSALTVFHQPSMEWYHVIWKEEMTAKGVKGYYKILPDDAMFKNSVQVGKANIAKKFPSFDFEKHNIRYFNSVEEALKFAEQI